MNISLLTEIQYTVTCLKGPLKSRPKYRFSRQIITLCKSKVLQNPPMQHFAVLSTCIKIPHGFETFVLSIFELRLKTGFNVVNKKASKKQ